MDLTEAENIKKRWQQQMESEANQLYPTLCDPWTVSHTLAK